MKCKALIALGFVFVVSQTSLSAFAETFQVPGDYPTIGAALEFAKLGDRIELAPGVYNEHSLIFPEGVTLEGMGEKPSEVVIDGGGQGRIILCESLLQASSIDNLTLTGGWAQGETSYDQSGGAIHSSNSSLRISNCVFADNRADSHGGAIRCNNSTLLIVDSVFKGNQAPNGGGGAVDCSYGSSPLFRNCDFELNSSSWGGALSCRADSSPMVTDSRFRNNSASGSLGFGGAVFSDFEATPVFTYTTFFGNSAKYGGALASFQDAETNLENCTITENSAQFSGAGLFCNDSSPRVTSSIIVFQDGTGIAAQGAAVPDISCTDIFGNSDGDWVGNIANQGAMQNNISADPIFCSDDLGNDLDFSLQDNSPCGSDANPCGTLGAWPVGCGLVGTQLTLFEADWSGDYALLSWEAISNGETPLFRLTGALESSNSKEWEIDFVEEGGGRYVGEDRQARADSWKRFVFRLYLLDQQGDASLLGETHLVSVPDHQGIKDHKAWPNPFNPLTTISFRLGRAQRTRVSIYTIDGRRIKTLASRVFGTGVTEIQWDGTDDGGRLVSAGGYIALIEGERQMQTVKLTLVK